MGKNGYGVIIEKFVASKKSDFVYHNYGAKHQRLAEINKGLQKSLCKKLGENIKIRANISKEELYTWRIGATKRP